MRVTPRYDGPALLEIAGPLDDQLVPLTRQRRRFETMLAGLTDDEWRAPTRCDGWTVQDVAAHLVGVNAFWQMSIMAGLAGEARCSPTSIPRRHRRCSSSRCAPPPGEVLAQLVASHDSLLGVISDLDDAGWAMPAECRRATCRSVCSHALWDCWIHERLSRSRWAARRRSRPTRSRRRCAAAAIGPASHQRRRRVPGRFAVDATGPPRSSGSRSTTRCTCTTAARPAARRACAAARWRSPRR